VATEKRESIAPKQEERARTQTQEHEKTAPVKHSVSQAEKPTADESDIFSKLEKLAQLHEKGILSAEEFSSKKTELLARL
jgi:hypothetical protein